MNEKIETNCVNDAKPCSDCMKDAPYIFCCKRECGEHEFCRGCNGEG